MRYVQILKNDLTWMTTDTEKYSIYIAIDTPCNNSMLKCSKTGICFGKKRNMCFTVKIALYVIDWDVQLHA